MTMGCKTSDNILCPNLCRAPEFTYRDVELWWRWFQGLEVRTIPTSGECSLPSREVLAEGTETNDLHIRPRLSTNQPVFSIINNLSYF